MTPTLSELRERFHRELYGEGYGAEYDPQADALYVSVSTSPVADTRVHRTEVAVDYDHSGNLVGVEFLHVLPSGPHGVDTGRMANIFHELGDRFQALLHEVGDEFDKLRAEFKPRVEAAVTDAEKGAQQTAQAVEQDIAK